LTVRAIVVDAVRLPEVPVMVTVTGPPVIAVLAAVSINTLELVAGLVAKDAVTPLGRPDAARFTLPVNPLAAVTAMVSVALLPWITDRLVGLDERVKLGAALTVRATVVDALSAPEVPLIVTVTGPPTVAVLLAASVSTCVPVVPAANAAVTPAGRPEALRATAPENPPTSATVIVLVALLP
jgi:hypothetical protein